MRIALAQMRHGDSLDENLTSARGLIATAREGGATLVLLPEHWSAHGPPTAEESVAVRRFFEEETRGTRCAIAGNLIEAGPSGKLWNVGVAYENGVRVLEQRKIHPMPREAAAGVEGGAGVSVANVLGRPMGVLVCADILYPEVARVLALQGAEVLLNPVMSPYREADDTKGARDAIFVARAYDSGAFVLKAAGFRRPEKERAGIAGRSLVAAPWGILAHYAEEFQEEILFADLDFVRLARFREHQASFPARRPEAYVGLL